MGQLRFPDWDMVADLVVPPDLELGLPGGSATFKQKRLYVAAWMLGEGKTDRDALEAALALYEGCGQDLLNKPMILTTASIVAEVLAIAAMQAEMAS